MGQGKSVSSRVHPQMRSPDSWRQLQTSGHTEIPGLKHKGMEVGKR